MSTEDLSEDYINYHYDLYFSLIDAIRNKSLEKFRKGLCPKQIKDFKGGLTVKCEASLLDDMVIKRKNYKAPVTLFDEKSLVLATEKKIVLSNEKSLVEIKETNQIIESNQNGVNDDIKRTITEKINNDFSWSRYGDYDLVMCNKNGYINASVLIEKATVFENKIRVDIKAPKLPRRDFDKWMKLKDSVLLCEVICFKKQIQYSDLFLEKKGLQKKGEELLQGIYLHPELINSVLMWVSPTYAHKINMFINKMNGEMEVKLKESRIRELTQDISEKSNLIMELRDAYNKISKDNEIIIENNKLILQELRNVYQSNQVISYKLDRTNGHLQDIKHNVKMETRDKDIIIPIRIYDSNNRIKHYKMAKTTDDNIMSVYKYYDKICSNFPLEPFRTVNAKNICKQFLAENKNITYKSSTVFLNSGYTEEEFINDLRKFLDKPIKKINKITN